MESAGSVDDPLRPQIGGVRAARRPEEMLPAALHPAVEGTPIRGIALIRRQSLRNLAYQTPASATPRRTLPTLPDPDVPLRSLIYGQYLQTIRRMMVVHDWLHRGYSQHDLAAKYELP